MMGEVVGVNTAIISESGMFAGIGFAIPSDTVKREVTPLILIGKYSHPWLGVSGVNIDPDIAAAISLNYTTGFLIASVVKGSPVENAGLKGGNHAVVIDGQDVVVGGDVIIGIDNISVRSLSDISMYMERNKHPGDTLTLTIIRAGQKMVKQVVVGVRPSP
jgi:S1-C subfamily serine protease